MSRNRIEQIPDEYRDDLNPDYLAGQNDGPAPHGTQTAYDIKDLHERLAGLRDDQLRQISILAEGTRLEQGAVYFDLRHPERGEFRAIGGMTAEPQNWLVPKSEVDYQVWNYLTGVTDPVRLGDLAGPANPLGVEPDQS